MFDLQRELIGGKPALQGAFKNIALVDLAALEQFQETVLVQDEQRRRRDGTNLDALQAAHEQVHLAEHLAPPEPPCLTGRRKFNRARSHGLDLSDSIVPPQDYIADIHMARLERARAA